MPKLPEAICIDLGDTVVDIHGAHYTDAVKSVLAYYIEKYGTNLNPHGYHLNPENIPAAATIAWQCAKSKTGNEFDPGKYMKDGFIRDLADVLGYALSEDAEKKVYNIYFETLVEKTRLMPKAKETLDGIKQTGLFMVLTSDILNEQCSRILTKHDLKSAFDIIMTSETAGASKPNGLYEKAFEAIKERLGISDLSYGQIITVGNSRCSDIEPAIILGMRTIELDSWPHNEPTETEYKPESQVNEFQEVLSEVKSMFES